MNVRWIIQNNLIAENDLNELQNACDKLGIEYFEAKVIPFSEDLPEFPIDDDVENIYYGSTTLMYNLYRELKPIGLFFNENFTMENSLSWWKDNMLSSAGEILTIQDYWAKPFDDDKLVFIRPNGDGKEFDGEVMTFIESVGLLYRHMKHENNLNINSKILVCEPYNILREWRNYIVDGKIVTSTLYRKNFKLNKSGIEIPEEMLEFTRDMIDIYRPDQAFAIDIAEVNDDGEKKFFIIETGCINSVGFYKANIFDYVKNISELVNKIR
jgi:hypothetical protein